MMRNVYTLKAQLRDSFGPLDREIRGENRVSKAEAKLIQPSAADVIVVGDQKAPVVLGVHIVRQQWVHYIDEQVLPVEAGIHLLLRCNDLIDSSVKTVCIRGNRDKGLVIQTTAKIARIRQRIVRVQQRQRGLAERSSDLIVGEGLACSLRSCRRIDKASCVHRAVRVCHVDGNRGSKTTEIPGPVQSGRDGILFRLRCPPAIAFIVKKEKGFVMSVIEMRNRERAAEAAAKSIEPFR